MTAQDLLSHARGLFIHDSEFVWTRCVFPSVPGGTEAGSIVQHFGFPAIVTERLRSGMRAIPDRYTCHAWLPASLLAEELAAGRFAAEPVQPKQSHNED